MSKAKRLKQIETTLTPKQAVLLWLKEAQQMGLLAYMEQQFNTPMHNAPRARLTEMVGKAVCEGLQKQGMEYQRIMRVAREAKKQTDFLVVLALDLQQEVHFECTLNEPYIELLYEKFRRMLEHFVQGKFAPSVWKQWRKVLIVKLMNLWRLRDTLEAISKKYFDHHAILFSEDARDLDSQIRILEELVAHYNSFNGRLPTWTGIKVQALRSRIQKEIDRRALERAANAKKRTLEDLGESEAAWKLVQPYAIDALRRFRASSLKHTH